MSKRRVSPIHLERARSLVGQARAMRRIREQAPSWRAGLGSAVDGAAMRVMTRVFLHTHRRAERRAGLDAFTQRAERYVAGLGDQKDCFQTPIQPVVSAVRRRSLPGGAIVDLTFPSYYAPQRSEAMELLRRYPENATARVRHYRHHRPGYPAVVCLHGWGGGIFRIEAGLWRARWLYDQGLDVYLYTHPYHAGRRPAEVALGATLYPSSDVVRTTEALLQTMWEVRVLLRYHRRHRDAGAGAMGMSLGGYATALAASVAPELEFAVPVLPIADLAALMWVMGDGSPDRRRAERFGITFDAVCAMMAIHSPLAYQPLVPHGRRLIIAGRADRIVPSAHAVALWEHWGKPSLHWFPGAHLLHFGRNGYLDAFRQMLRHQGILPGAGSSVAPAGSPSDGRVTSAPDGGSLMPSGALP